MPRREIPFAPNQYYHFYQRGNNRQSVFFERENYLYFLKGIKKYLVEKMDMVVYCLMPTHYHFLARIKPAASEEVALDEISQGVSQAMQKLGISYTKAINKRFNRSGALFESQFQAKPIQKYEHLLTLCLYIHANPVKDGLTARPEDWEYSNYREWLNLRAGTLVDKQFIVENFGTPAEYRSLLLETIQTRYVPEDMRAYFESLG